MLAVVAYPELSSADHAWIESIRRAHDPQTAKIAAHFTLLFPASVDRSVLHAAAGVAARAFAAIPFVLKIARAIHGSPTADAHVFLLPEEGRDRLVALHDRLHDGELGALVDRARPFVPHLTVAAKHELQECSLLAGEWQRKHLPMKGTIRSIDLIEVLPHTVRTLAAFALGPSSHSDDLGRISTA
jgi:2'-5' RNA ligase